MSDGTKFFRLHYCVSLRDDVQILPFLVYLIEVQGLSFNGIG